METSRHGYEVTDRNGIHQWVRETTTDHFKYIVNNEIKNLKDITPRTWKIAAYNIVKNIKESPQMVTLLRTVTNDLVGHIDTNATIDQLSSFQNVGAESTSRQESVSSNRVNWDETDLNAVSPKHYQQLVDDTCHNSPVLVRVKALYILLNIQLSDTVTSHIWPQLQQNLQDGLCDDNMEVFNMCIKIHSKLTSPSSEPFLVKEGFLGLINGLRSHYCYKFNQQLPNFDQGLEVSNSTHVRLTRISHHILYTVKDIPKGWIRFGEKLVENIVSAFIALLTMHTNDNVYSRNIIYPLHLLATLDPKASWCSSCFHGEFGRSMFFKQPRVLALLRYAVEEIYAHITSPIMRISAINEETCRVPSQIVKLATFGHSLNIFSVIGSYNTGQKLFPLQCKIPTEPLSLQDVIDMLMLSLNEQSGDISSSNEKNITQVIIKFIKCVSSPLLSDYSFIKILVEPMQSLVDNHHSTPPDHYNIPSYTIEILNEICSFESGICYVLGVDTQEKDITGVLVHKATKRQKGIKKSLNDDNFCSAKIIMQYTVLLLKCKSVDKQLLISLIEMCSKLYQYYGTFSIMAPFNLPLISLSVCMYKQLCSQYDFEFPSSQLDTLAHNLLRVLANFLHSVGSSPLGVLALSQYDSLISEVMKTLLQGPCVSWENANLRRLVTLLTTIPEGATALAEESGKTIAQTLCHLWALYEEEVAVLKGSYSAREKGIREFMNIVFAGSCTLAGTKALLTEHEGSEDTLIECGMSPTTISDLLSCSEHPYHYVNLLVIQAMATNLDVWLYLENSLQIQNRLLQLQSENVSTPLFEEGPSEQDPEDKKIIIDECSLLRHQILMATYIIGGPTERPIPSLDIDLADDDDSGLELFAELPVLPTRSAGTQSMWPKVNSEIQSLLQDTRVGLRDTNWLVRARKAFRASRQGSIKAGVLLDLVEQVSCCGGSHPYCTLTWPINGTADSVTLCKEELLGVTAAVRYGTQGHLLQPSLPNEENLQQFLQISKIALNHNGNASTFKGFDWFAATVFLLCSGHVDKCCSFLNHFVALPVAMFLWPALAEAQGICNLGIYFSHLLESVIAIEVPIAHKVLQLSGVPWGTVCFAWLTQTFWNVMDWSQLCHWLALCILHPPDMIMYFCVALLKHLQPKLLKAARHGTMWEEIKLTPVAGFKVGDHIIYMEKLVRRHRSSILPTVFESIAKSKQ